MQYSGCKGQRAVLGAHSVKSLEIGKKVEDVKIPQKGKLDLDVILVTPKAV